MRTASISLILSFSLADVTTALYVGKWCPRACDLTLDYATFNDTGAQQSRKARKCRSEKHITSLYLCFEEYCKDDGERDSFLHEEVTWCEERIGVTLPSYQDVVNRWTPEYKAGVKRLSADEGLEFPILGEVVVPDDMFFERAFTTLDAANFEYDIHLIYGWYMYYFWISVVSLGILARLLSSIRSLIHQNKGYRPVCGSESEIPIKPRKTASLPNSWLKRYLTTPAAFGNRCSQTYGWCTIPPRIQSLTIFFFVALNVVLCTISYRLTSGNLYWPQKSAQLLRFVSDRTGIISLANFPLVWLFGMRNDALMWVTGWGFGTYNAFHRWVARVATAQAVVHSIGYTIMTWEDGGWFHFKKYLHKHYFWNGELATIAMCGLLAFSVYGLRRAHYEIFLITHIVLSVTALWSMYYHVEIFVNGEWNIFIWPCLGVWTLDRVLRVARILAFHWRFWNTKATVSYDPSSNLVKMEVDGSKSWTRIKPGTYYYIHVLNDLCYAHQSHPFTLAYVSSDTNNLSPTPLSTLSPRPPPPPQRTDSFESSESDALLSTSSRTSSRLVFLIRPYDGFTSRLKKHCLLHPKKLRVLIEGPYGHTIPLNTYPNVLFIVGGTGIAVPLSHLSHLLHADSHVQSVKIVWAVREHAFLASILQEFHALLEDERVEIEVHITQDEEVKDDLPRTHTTGMEILTGRPNVHAVVEEAARGAGQISLAIVACGPARMADQARKASVDMLGEGLGGVEYFEESFKW
ncbi:ferric-chelate reductase-like protein [Dothidotthia symphoricarpi CBS 119687]|uniref:Ferric-chelate reductase-like protein n=1 Tax=Dothidotthia symphoricarpi CBS 119687 TaxID=1392245 RepID=A0A6A6A350_9PLEO|nr:ferric-chelate reductase-like protein [Dothidotthia symphoricarpi CBS 119687]KAF2125976.1 ferric-chelate reductase-like protein [Dothidotthia symphoricarpi CBS 119687]